MSTDDTERMARMTALMETSAKAAPADVLEWNREFHFGLYRASGMPTLVKMIESLWLQVGPLLNLQQQVFAQKKITVYVQHHRALDGLKTKKADGGPRRDRRRYRRRGKDHRRPALTSPTPNAARTSGAAIDQELLDRVDEGLTPASLVSSDRLPMMRRAI